MDLDGRITHYIWWPVNGVFTAAWRPRGVAYLCCQMGLGVTEKLASGVWATLVRLNILKMAMLDRWPGCVLGSMDREPADGAPTFLN